MIKKFFALIMVFTIFVPAAASAHSLYIQAGRYHVSEGKKSPLFFCYGHHVPVDDAVRMKKINHITVQQPDGKSFNIELRDEKSLHAYLVNYSIPGTYVLTAATNPGHFTTWLDKKGRKRHSIKPMSSVKERATEIVTSLRSSQWTKTYVVCENPSAVFPAIVGMPMELVPAKDVSMLRKGDMLEMQVYMDGKPYHGEGYWDATYNGFSTQAEDMYIQRQQIHDGKIKLPIDVSGRWFVRFFTKKEPMKESSDFMQEKKTTTLVFEVPNERKRPKLDSH
ncbi:MULTISPECIES: DUF4198 domain-containing protein [unclassified Maridesulfovibrio]|uniref:DUF4198 domain-containing protein n=1 Tax=unclassified Maridesulfovibrio TaxID=2794999 RepID=UPI003B41B5E3